jgi:hypothetical protein
VEVEAGADVEVPWDSVMLGDSSLGPGNGLRLPTIGSTRRRMQETTTGSATSASQWPAARGRLLLSGGPWAYEGGGRGDLREQHRW